MPEWLSNLLKENEAAGRRKAQRYGEMTGEIRARVGGLLRILLDVVEWGGRYKAAVALTKLGGGNRGLRLTCIQML